MKTNSNDTRIRKIDDSLLKILKKISADTHSLGNKFWVIVEQALAIDNAPLEIHVCNCGAIVILPRSYVIKVKNAYEKNGKAPCWHVFNLLTSISALNASTHGIVDKVSILLRENKYSEAFQISSGLLPKDSFNNFDYSLWRLQYALAASRYFNSQRKDKRRNYLMHYIKSISELGRRIKDKYPSEYKKFIDYYNEKNKFKNIMESVETAMWKISQAEEILNNAAYHRLSKSYNPTRFPQKDRELDLKRYYQFLLDSYQAYFEITEIIEFLYSLVLIDNGNGFIQNPFKGKSINKRKIGNKKALMIEKIIEDSKSIDLNKKLSLAFNNKLRNSTAGHNDYIVDPIKEKVTIKTTKKTYSINYIEEKINRIYSLVSAFLILTQLAGFEKDELSLSLMGTTSIATTYDKKNIPQNTLIMYQFWSNFDLDREGKNINLLNFKLSKDRKTLYFSPNKEVPIPGACEVQASKQLYMWLKKVLEYDEVEIVRYIISPKIEFFLRAAKYEIKLKDVDYFVIASTGHRVSINKPRIKKILKVLKNKNLPEENSVVNENFMLKEKKEYKKF